MITEIVVNVSFLNRTLTKTGTGVVEGDYNTTKLIFNFEEDLTGKRIVFKMSNPSGEAIFLKELDKNNEVMLVGKDASGNNYSLFPTYGLYPFELVLYDGESKLTSAPGWITAMQRQVSILDPTTTPYLPLFDELLNDLSSNRVFVVFSEKANGSDFTTNWTENSAYIGIAVGQVAPSQASGYKWHAVVEKIEPTTGKGEKAVMSQKATTEAIDADFDVSQSVNLLDEEKVTIGVYISKDGVETSHDSYTVTDYIPVKEGDVIAFQGLYDGNSTHHIYKMAFVCAFDGNKTVLPASGSNTALSSYTVPSGVAYVRLSTTHYKSCSYRMVHLGTDVIPYEPYWVKRILKEESHNEEYIKGLIVEEVSGNPISKAFDSYTSPNLLDETKVTAAYMSEQGKETPHATFGLTDYIPVKEGDVLTFQGKATIDGETVFYSFRFVCAFDGDKKVLTDKGSNSVTSYTVPTGVYYVRLTLSAYANIFKPMVHLGKQIIPYESYGTYYVLKEKSHNEEYIKGLIEANSGKMSGRPLALPKTLYGFVGYPISIYYRNVMDYHPNDVYIRKKDIVNTKGKLYSNRWEYTPTTAETIDGSIQVFDHDYNKINEQNIPVIVKDSTTKESLTVLVIGDSTVNEGLETGKMLELAEADGYSLTLLGTRGSGDNQHEGRGGWKAEMYCTMATNSSGSVVNAFYNPTSETFDFAYYMAQQGYNGVDCVFLQLGINDMFGAWDNTRERYVNTFIGYMQTMVNSIHSYDSNIKIVINLAIPCGDDQDAFVESYSTSTTWNQRKNIYEANIALLNTFEDMDNVYVSHYNAAIDAVNNLRGDVHPNNEGYAQLGTQMYSFMRAIN